MAMMSEILSIEEVERTPAEVRFEVRLQLGKNDDLKTIAEIDRRLFGRAFTKLRVLEPGETVEVKKPHGNSFDAVVLKDNGDGYVAVDTGAELKVEQRINLTPKEGEKK